MDKVQLSVVVPFYNEEENLPELHQELVSVLEKIKTKSEVVYVNDGSTDRSMEVLKKGIGKEEARKNVVIKIIALKKNFGQTAAISAGINNSLAEYISFLDSDLQNDPNDIPRFLEKISEGYDAVFGWRKERKDATLRSFLSKAANRIINLVFSYPYHDVGCSAKLVKRESLRGIELYGELHRIMPVLVYLNGAKVTELVVTHRPRYKGKSKYGFERIFKTLIDIITVKFLNSYGTRPAYIFGSIGLFCILISIVATACSAYKKLFLGVFVHTDPLFLIAIFFGIVGIQFVLMGLLAELQVRTYFESQNKAIYEIKSKEEY
jgi:glycosyltransferase involved in cell wall biosynthesis